MSVSEFWSVCVCEVKEVRYEEIIRRTRDQSLNSVRNHGWELSVTYFRIIVNLFSTSNQLFTTLYSLVG